jgi:GPI mannosyltransferase 3
LQHAGGLAWEYAAKSRSGLQPFIAYCVIGTARFWGCTDPFFQTFLLRLGSGLAAFGLYFVWLRRLLSDFEGEKAQGFFIVLCCTAWFMPFVLVRFSSENTAATAFFAGLYLLLYNFENNKKTYFKFFLAGFLLGLSFFFRFQMAFALIGLGAWLIFIQKTPLKTLTLLFLGGLLSFVLNTVVDFWLYGAWVLSPVRYFTANILEHKAASFGTEPFYWYLPDLVLKTIPPIGLLFFIGFFGGCFTQKRHVFTWITLVFVFAHSMVGHKETRFLFPLLLPFFYLSAMGCVRVWQYFQTQKPIFLPFLRVFLIFCIIINALLLCGRCVLPAENLVAYHRYLYQYSKQNPSIEIVSLETDIYQDTESAQHFYKTPSTTQTLPNTAALQAFLNEKKPNFIVLVKKYTTTPTNLNGYTAQPLYNLLPQWLHHFNINNWQERANFWEVFLLKKQD